VRISDQIASRRQGVMTSPEPVTRIAITVLSEPVEISARK
jgi:hypothetical protein